MKDSRVGFSFLTDLKKSKKVVFFQYGTNKSDEQAFLVASQSSISRKGLTRF